ncbi:hypothetical protein LXL04_019353 [Taraxacum kok-saghyz]
MMHTGSVDALTICKLNRCRCLDGSRISYVQTGSFRLASRELKQALHSMLDSGSISPINSAIFLRPLSFDIEIIIMFTTSLVSQEHIYTGLKLDQLHNHLGVVILYLQIAVVRAYVVGSVRSGEPSIPSPTYSNQKLKRGNASNTSTWHNTSNSCTNNLNNTCASITTNFPFEFESTVMSIGYGTSFRFIHLSKTICLFVLINDGSTKLCTFILSGLCDRFKYSSGNLLITDTNHKILLKVKPCDTSLHHQRVLLDVHDKPIVLIRNKIMSLHHRWDVFKGDSKSKSDMIFSTKAPDIFCSKSIHVLLANKASNKDVCDYKIKGRWSERDCTISMGDTSITIAQVVFIPFNLFSNRLHCFRLFVYSLKIDFISS